MKTAEIEGKPWERCPRESSRAYFHFELYVSMGATRSLRRVAEDVKCTSKVRQLSRWSVRWQWVDRAAAYDDDQARLLRIENQKKHLAMMERHCQTALRGLSLVVSTLERLMAEFVADPSKTLNVQDATRLMDVCVKVERLSRGLPSEISELGSSAEKPLRISLIRELAQNAVKDALGITDEPVLDRVEAEETEPGPELEAAADAPDPFGSELVERVEPQ